LVEKTGWSSGNSLSIIITGTGERTAVSYDGNPGGAPLLHVEFDPPNRPPVASDDSASTREDTAVTIDVAANDTDPDGNLDPSSASVTAAASNGVVTHNGNGTFDYTPDPDYCGSDSFVYEICDTDGLCDTATVHLTITLSMALSPGWNLVSWPLVLLSESLTDTLAACSACDETWAYDAWHESEPWVQWPDDLGVADETMGLWLHATDAVTLSLAGTPAVSPTIELRTGWNLVGYPSQTARPVAEALSSITGKYTHVATYYASDPADPWRECGVDLPPCATDLLLMEPGRGYWLEVSEDCTWIIEGDTPSHAPDPDWLSSVV
jgi:hypothetical protein